ncbi:hypothetical protein [Tenacibaculum maritimum]|uniref:hypothetical protein n=1 Tax=Tenacibaculum maritimum TaxID=107401 RepID=UPI001E45E434|nr:hypothetical protein [Tenacibaculum maritimum]MCD9583914.1 hypothetical protein [Tenacibaculum maritimum]MCD9620528.1 hypothetical protein [Tenacibaculum maritimum]MCD9626625.1 hypothetical protein [Tenacibaculum maritimum]MCD9629339.1 hypothetical protein [Tenacibaculum maritimum]MCD9631966.1 hypothetical protein [Tenacibaculum maritimum]
MKVLIKSNVSKKINLLLKIFLAPLLCIISLYFIRISFEYHSLSFALITSMINLKKMKLNLIKGIILNIIFSFIIFIGGYTISLFLMSALEPLFGEDLSGFIGMLIGTYILAPIALFSTYKFIFIWTRGKLTNNIIVVSIIILIFFNFLIYINIIPYKVNNYLIWQLIISLVLQLVLYQKKIITLFKGKSSISK